MRVRERGAGAAEPAGTETLRAEVRGPADVDLLRRRATALARTLGFDRTGAALVGLATATLGTTLADHAPGGLLLVSPLERDGVRGADVLALDRGGALAAHLAPHDGPAVAFPDLAASCASLAARVTPGRGSAVVARVWSAPLPAADVEAPFEVGAVSVPAAGGRAVGSAWAADRRAGAARLLLAEGAGARALAAETAALAIRTFAREAGRPPGEVVRAVDRALAGTRGAGLAVLDLDEGAGMLRVAATGGVRVAVLDEGTGRELPHGAERAGSGLPAVEETLVPWDPDGLAVLATPGAAGDLLAHLTPAAAAADPALTAAGIVRDAVDDARDATVAVLRRPGADGPGPALELLATVPLRVPSDARTARERARATAEALGLEPAAAEAFVADVARLVAGALERMGATDLWLGVRRGAAGEEVAALVADLVAEDDVPSGLGVTVVPVGGSAVLAGVAAPRPAGTGPVDRDALEPGDATARVDRDLAQVERKNRELSRALSELRVRQAELRRVGAELEDTNQAVAALHEQLETQAAELRRANAAQSRLLAAVAHEIRTPVHAIRGLVDLVLEAPELGEATRDDVKAIGDAASTVLDLVAEQLESARLEAGRTVVRLGLVEVATLFSSLRGAMRAYPRRPEVELDIGDTDGLPDLWTDAGKVDQILRNLVSNALKFTEQGSVRVTAEAAGDHVRFVVADTGPGIAPEDHERVFEEFVQSATSSRATAEGTGLGLPLARRLAELLGGRLDLDSAPGRGTTMTLVLPVQFASADPGVEVVVRER